MSFSNPVAKSVGADGTAPGRVWESRLLPALITPNSVVGGVLCVPDRARAPHPPFCCFVCLFACFMRGFGAGVCRGGVLQRGWACCKGAGGCVGVIGCR